MMRPSFALLSFLSLAGALAGCPGSGERTPSSANPDELAASTSPAAVALEDCDGEVLRWTRDADTAALHMLDDADLSCGGDEEMAPADDALASPPTDRPEEKRPRCEDTYDSAAELAACTTRHDPGVTLTGSLKITWTVGTDGRVTGMSVAEDSVGHAEITACLQRSIEGTTFPGLAEPYEMSTAWTLDESCGEAPAPVAATAPAPAPAP